MHKARQRRLQLNPEKTELIWFGGRAKQESLQAMGITIRLRQVDIEPVDSVRDLGVLLDSSLSMHQHIARVTSTCFLHLRRLRKISCILDIETWKRLVCALELTHIEIWHGNSALAGLSDSPGAVTASTPCGGALCFQPAATRSCHGRTSVIPLAASAPVHHVQVVHIDAWCSLWLRTDISTGRHRDTLATARKSASVVGGQRTIQRAMGVGFRWFKSSLRRRSTSLESTPCISSPHELCRNF